MFSAAIFLLKKPSTNDKIGEKKYGLISAFLTSNTHIQDTQTNKMLK